MATSSNYSFTFRYKGKTYSKNTRIKVSQKYIDNHLYEGMPIWPYARFDKTIIKNNKAYCMFSICEFNSCRELNAHAGYFVVSASDLDILIDEIRKPVVKENIASQPAVILENDISSQSAAISKKDWRTKGMGIAWIAYIATLMASLIFKDFYIIWIVASCVFFKYRKEKLNK